MGYVPADARWFLADLVVEIRVEGDPDNVVHVNTVLVRADSAEEAYTKALELGVSEESRYDNPEGKAVSISFRGLGALGVIHDELEHGTELIYTEEIGLDESEVARLISPKDSLWVFRDREPSAGPNYMPKDIMDMLEDMMGPEAARESLWGDRP